MIEWILTSSVLIGVVLLLRQALKDRISQRLRYGLWAIVLVRLLLPFSLTQSSISISAIAKQPIAEIETLVETPIRSDAYEAAIEEISSQFFTQKVDPATLTQEELDSAIRQNVYEQVVAEQTQSSAPLTQQQIEEEVDSRMKPMYTVSPVEVLTALWLTGTAVMGAVFLYCNIRLALNLRRTRVSLPISHSLPVYMTDYVATPCLFGIGSCAIYLPREAAENPDIHHILAHETTHHRQGDHIWSVLRCLCLALHWYNPLVWLAAAASKVDAELACDEATIARLGENQRTAYGRTLIAMTCARQDPKDLFLTATTMNTGKRTLKERVTMIAKHPKTAVYTLILLIAVLLIAVGCTFTGPQNQDNPPSVTTEPAETTEPQTHVPDTTVPLSDIRSFPEGEIQAVLLYVNGNLYVRSDTTLEMEPVSGSTLLGTVQQVSNRKEPYEEFHATHLPEGTEIYSIPRTESMILVKDSDTGLYFRMNLINFVDIWWRKQPEENQTPGFTEFTPQGTAASQETCDVIAALFQGPYSWYTLATTSCYMTPEEVDLGLMFYNGIFREQVTLSDGEKQYLSNTWLGSVIGELEFNRIKADDIDDVLEYHFGIELNDSIKRGTQNWVYWDKTDCYYQAHNDCLDQGIEIRGIYIRDGGLVDVYYLSDIAQYGVMEYYVMTLQLIGNRFVIRSNWRVDNLISLVEPTARFGICVPMGYDSEGPLGEYELSYFNTLFQPINNRGELNILCSFFNCWYDSPRELNLTEFLRYNALGRSITSGGDFDAICREHGYTDFVPTPIHKYEADEIDEVLELYMGIALDDLKNRKGGDDLTYLRQYDAYYNTTSDAGFGTFTADRGEYSGGRIILYDDRGEGGVAILTLKIQGNFCLIESHMLAIPD